MVELDRAARHGHRRRRASRYGELAERARRGPWRCTTWPRCRTSRWPARSRPRRTARATRNGNLATAVAALELVTSDGELADRRARRRRLRRAWWSASARSAWSRASRSTSSRPSTVRQRVFEGLALGRAARALRRDHGRRLQRQRVHALGRRRSIRCGSRAASTDAPEACRRALRRAPRPPSSATRSSASTRSTAPPQLGVPGPVVRPPAALPHGLHAQQPARSSSREYLVAARARRRGARRRCAPLGDRIRPLLQVSEIRTVAADELWLSPQYGRDTRRHPLHLAPRPGRCRARAVGDRGGARAVRARGRTGARRSSKRRAPLRPPGRLRGARRAARSTRRVSQRVDRRAFLHGVAGRG